MSQGLWSVELRVRISKKDLAGVVVVLEGQRIIGGDSQYFYVGNYEVKDGTVQGDIEVNRYGSDPPPPIFGSLGAFGRKFHVKVSGRHRNRLIELQRHVVEDPKRKFVVSLSKKAGLP